MVEHQPCLAQVIEPVICNALHAPVPGPARFIAYRAEAAWHQARTITTVEQLDALPVGSVVMPLWYLEAGPCWRLSDGWFMVFSDLPMHPLGSRRKGNSALLIWHPDWSRDE